MDGFDLFGAQDEREKKPLSSVAIFLLGIGGGIVGALLISMLLDRAESQRRLRLTQPRPVRYIPGPEARGLKVQHWSEPTLRDYQEDLPTWEAA
jgi:hypothetical protein